MKLVLAALGLFLSLATVGIACGPKETFCYAEGMTCSVVAAMMDAQGQKDDSSDAGDACGVVYGVDGAVIPCD